MTNPINGLTGIQGIQVVPANDFPISQIPFAPPATQASDFNYVPTYVPEGLISDLTTSIAPSPTVPELFDKFLSEYAYPYKIFTTWENFQNEWYNYPPFKTLLATNPGATQKGLYEGLLKDFKTILGLQLGNSADNYQMTSGDWQILNDSPVVSPAVSFADSTDANNPFVRIFNQFLTTYTKDSYPPKGGPAISYANNFITKFQTYLTDALVLLQNDKAYIDPDAANQNAFDANYVGSYETIYYTYAKDPTAAGFKTFLNAFYTNQVNLKGYFLSASSAGDFFTAVNNNDPRNLLVNELPGSSISETKSNAVLVLNRILSLLIQLIKTLENVGIVQANRLSFYTKFQNAYTALQSQVPTFTKGQIYSTTTGATYESPLGAGSTEAGESRNNLNSSFNGLLTDNLRSLRAIQEDNAKKLQSNINTTNDAVNQQTDMATTFIQQMSTLLSSILR